MYARFALAAAAAALPIVIMVASADQPEPVRATQAEIERMADASVGQWLPLAAAPDSSGEPDQTEESNSLESSLTAINELVRLKSELLEWEDRDPAPALDDFGTVLRAWVTNDMRPLLDARLAAGLALDRSMMDHAIANAVEWGFLDEAWRRETHDVTEADALQALLDAQVRSGMAIDGVDADTIEVGFGVAATMNSTEWPHFGMVNSRSKFRAQSGFFGDGSALEDTYDSLHVRLRVRLKDGRIGLIRFLYLYDSAESLWIPIGAVNTVYQRADYAAWCFAI